MNPCKILGFRPRTRWQLVVRAATKRTSATNLYYYYFLYFSSFYCNVGASVHLPLLRALENVQKFLENRQYFGGNWSGVESPQENDDGSFQPRLGGLVGWRGTKQNMYHGSLIKHDVDIQGSTVFTSRKAVSRQGDKGWISICRAT